MKRTLAYTEYQYLKGKINLTSQEMMQLNDLAEVFRDNVVANNMLDDADLTDQAVAFAHESEHNNMDLTLPGYNYLGPGTKIVHNLLNDVQPVNKLDATAYEHDWDYLMAENDYDIKLADERFRTNTIASDGLGPMSAYLIAIKQKFIDNARFMSDLTPQQQQKLLALRDQLSRNPNYY